ncbi:hypothetical protein E5676_scaffold2612G00190 [Cucumis melo var. makuwa]|uniref:Uncharacterized protein n=1 Tax=Cucumis melo var. makuwa TaxID=1194695 RepID=A0A5A7T5V7_CUCMM|nr:hypothetical protein E6C27_scaffold1170G00290 [Cucumis melo var. makuwa]TYJ96012.1 hypothetical protein E5676_scaffold2612G00190 [Cucumis melo var. makuwa]
MAPIHEIGLTDDECAYLDQSLKIPMTEGYEKGRDDPISHHHLHSPPRHVGCPTASIEQPIEPNRPQATFDCSQHGKVVDSKNFYGGNEGMSFNAPKVDTLVDSVFVDVPPPIIDDQPIDNETRTSISKDLGDGIILIDIPSRDEDVSPTSVQPLLESKKERSSPFIFSDVVPKYRMTRKRGIP